MKHALGRHLKVVDAPEPHQVTIAELGPQDVGRIVCVRAERAAVVGPLDSQPTSKPTELSQILRETPRSRLVPRTRRE